MNKPDGSENVKSIHAAAWQFLHTTDPVNFPSEEVPEESAFEMLEKAYAVFDKVMAESELDMDQFNKILDAVMALCACTSLYCVEGWIDHCIKTGNQKAREE